MAAISLGNTTVIAFTSNDYNSEARGNAFIKATNKIMRALRDSDGVGFIGSVGMDGTFFDFGSFARTKQEVLR